MIKTQYELYLCDITGDHQPIARFESSTPFMPVSVGERFDDHGWQRLDGVDTIASEADPKRYIVHSIKHTVVIKNNTLHVQYWINLHPYDGPRSPAWKEDQ